MVDSSENPLLSKATSQKSNEKKQEPNPYNMKKDYLDYDAMDEAAKPRLLMQTQWRLRKTLLKL